MRKEFYDKLAEPFERDEGRRKRLLKLNTVITNLVYAVYPVLLVVSLFMRDKSFFKVLLVPAVTFFLVTLFRKLCNAKRPYEVWEISPLISKETKGHSFPSRHVFSIYMIAMAAGYLWWPLAIVLFVAGVFLAAARVVGRVHFLKDVIAGATLGVGLGIVGFYVL